MENPAGAGLIVDDANPKLHQRDQFITFFVSIPLGIGHLMKQAVQTLMQRASLKCRLAGRKSKRFDTSPIIVGCHIRLLDSN